MKPGSRGPVARVHAFQTSEREILDRRAAHVDVSDESERPLRFGQETIMVNASIRDVWYRPTQAPWLVDLELPLKRIPPKDQ